ncbi:MAG TPA: carboxypeptidase-like regulatory domain-containing protein [Streptosporangiaceae bacterium]|nr:carboxypeptidase-like regulatory domain-containing protein [Streptosporangiaceae bacterium]
MRIQPTALRAASTVTILGTALAAALLSAPAQASGSGANTGTSPRTHLSLSAATAPAGEDGVIAGVVDGTGGMPLTGVCVVATGSGGSTAAVTRSDGRYSIAGLRPGGYTLHYSACAAGSRYADQWSGGASWPGGAATVTVARGQAREAAPVTLRTTTSAVPAAISRAMARLSSAPAIPGGLARLRSAALSAATKPAAGAKQGAITGNVTGAGKPLRGICVIAYGSGFGQVHTSKTGHFRIAKLRPGRYTVIYATEYCGESNSDSNSNWLPQIYKNVNGPAFRHPTAVRVTAGHTTAGINAALQLGGQISGTVRSQHGKSLLSRVCVFAQGKDGRFFVGRFGISGKKGRYTVHALFPGKYKVAFVPEYCGNTGNYTPQWWPDSATQKHAKTIVITHGLLVKNVDAALRPGAILTGVARAGGPSGALLKGICVSVQPLRVQGPFPIFAFTRTGSGGGYRVVGLTTGKYRVFFNRGCGNNGNFLPVQRSVSVVVGHTTSGFDGFMPAGAIIKGTVTNSHGAPVRGICVSASGARSGGGNTTNAHGTYSIIALQTGSYTLSFSGGCGNPGSYAPQYYRGQVNLGAANAVNATAGRTTSGIDATMQPGGTITGIVTDSSGRRLNRVCVLVENPSLARYGFPFNVTFTKHGAYTVRNLIPGPYSVNFDCFLSSNRFASQWFMNQPGEGSADLVSAPAGVVTSGISAALRHGGFITGVVTKSGGKRFSNICVEATPHGGPVAAFNFFTDRSVAYTDGSGDYRLGPLAATTYDVRFGCAGNRFANQWYRASASRASATPVTVTNGGTTTGIDAALTGGGSISGVVTAGANHPQPDVCVEAQDTADDSFGFAYTGVHGHFTISGLSSGPYKVTFFDCGFGRHHILLGTATRLATVIAPKAVTLNEKLVPAGSISGLVLGGPGAAPQAGVCVVAVPVSPNVSYDYELTGSHGRYQMTGLAPGKYNVYFGDPFCVFSGSGYAPQWYNDQASQATATQVTVTSGDNTKNIDATLGADGAISGTVTSHGHTPVAGECVTATPVAPVPDPVTDSVLGPVVGVTAADGTYTLVGLQPGKYKAKFSVGCGDTGFDTQWWHGASSEAGATIITVPANTTVAGIDAKLHHDGD